MQVTKGVKARASALRKQLKEKPQLFAHLADCYLLMGKHKQAGETLTHGLELFPNNPAGWLVKANLNLKLKQPKLAYAAFKQVLRLDNNVAYAHERCSILMFEEANIDKYLHHLRELRRLEPLDDGVQARYENAVLRRIAIDNGLYTAEGIANVLPRKLRQIIMEHNLLPDSIERAGERILSSIPPDTQAPALIDDSQVETVEEVDEFQPSEWTDKIIDESETGIEVDEAADEESPESVDTTSAEEITVKEETPESFVHEVIEHAGPDDAEEEPEIHESPLMKLLRGEMVEQKTSREVHFIGDDQTIKNNAGTEFASKVLNNGEAEARERTDVKSERLKQQEEAQRRIARIARTVTTSFESEPYEPVKTDEKVEIRQLADEHEVSETETAEQVLEAETEAPIEEPPIGETSQDPTPEPETEPEPEPEPEPSDIPEETTSVSLEPDIILEPEVTEEIETADEMPEEKIEPEPEPIEVPQPEVLPAVAEEPVKKASKGRIPTKTLAELFASQGDYKSAMEVYEEMLSKHPSNEFYRRRIEAFKSKLEEAE
ncbi:hypothetical protein HQ587_11150 [bacterium]|nr:hypothetical protein [bacterium]